MVLQIHETGRIEGNGHRWASVLVILSDEFVVVCMSFAFRSCYQIGRSVTREKQSLSDQLGRLPRCGIEATASPSFHRPQPMGRAATKSVARVYADVNAKLGPSWHEYGMMVFYHPSPSLISSGRQSPGAVGLTGPL